MTINAGKPAIETRSLLLPGFQLFKQLFHDARMLLFKIVFLIGIAGNVV